MKGTTSFLKRLKMVRGILTFQQYRTIRGQAIAGDLEGARAGLNKILERRGAND